MRYLKILIVLIPLLLVHVVDADAKGYSSGRGSFSGGGGFKTSTPKVSTPSTPKSTAPKSTAPKSTAPKSTTPKSTTPKNNSVKNNQQRSDWSNTLITAAGVYLILESFDDDGNPVYADEETGEKITYDELQDMEFDEVEEDDNESIELTSAEVEETTEDVFSFVAKTMNTLVLVLAPFCILALIMGLFRRRS